MQPFIKVNCAAISKELLEAEFFGYERGSFTGANPSGKKGFFELADNGTIFLDEVGELPQEVQAKLLRVIQDGEFYRVGGVNAVKTNVRIISATNKDLEEATNQNRFRRDLYYRLNVFPLRVPPLSQRRQDIPALVSHFLRQYGEKFGLRRGISQDALDYLKNRDWPGNIRELENLVQRLLISAKGEEISVFDVMKELHVDLFDSAVEEAEFREIEGPVELDLPMAVRHFEKIIIKRACEKYKSSRKAAKAIGISQTQLVRKKKKYEL